MRENPRLQVSLVEAAFRGELWVAPAPRTEGWEAEGWGEGLMTVARLSNMG
jgi:hypothetical protein